MPVSTAATARGPSAHEFASSFDAPRSRRLWRAAVVAVAASALATLGLLMVERMSIHRVAAPSLTQDFLFAPTLMEAPKPPPPPEIEHKAAAAGSTDDSPPEAESKHEPLFDEVPTSMPKTRAKASVPGSGGPPNPFASGTGGPMIPGACVGPHCPTASQSRLPARGPAPDPIHVKRSQLRCTACPDPSALELRSVASPGFRGGHNITQFCVDTRGKTESVRTKRSSGDAKVDAALRARVQRWRLQAYRVGSQTRRACTEVRFEIEMK